MKKRINHIAVLLLIFISAEFSFSQDPTINVNEMYVPETLAVLQAGNGVGEVAMGSETEPGSPPFMFYAPFSMRVKNGKIYIIESTNKILVFNYNGELVEEIRIIEVTKSLIFCDFIVTNDGKIIASDYGYGKLFIYDLTNKNTVEIKVPPILWKYMNRIRKEYPRKLYIGKNQIYTDIPYDYHRISLTFNPEIGFMASMDSTTLTEPIKYCDTLFFSAYEDTINRIHNKRKCYLKDIYGNTKATFEIIAKENIIYSVNPISIVESNCLFVVISQKDTSINQLFYSIDKIDLSSQKHEISTIIDKVSPHKILYPKNMFDADYQGNIFELRNNPDKMLTYIIMWHKKI